MGERNEGSPDLAPPAELGGWLDGCAECWCGVGVVLEGERFGARRGGTVPRAVMVTAYTADMDAPQSEATPTTESMPRFVRPDEELSAAAQEALDRRSAEQHQAAIDRALRHR